MMSRARQLMLTTQDVASAVRARWLSSPRCSGSGFDPLDKLMPGLLLPGRMTVIGARPAAGKTAVAMQVAEHVATADDDVDVIVVSLEMTGEALLHRYVTTRAIASGTPLCDPHLWQDERDRAAIDAGIEAWTQLPLIIIDQARTRATVQSAIIEAVSATRARGRHVGLVVVDYLQQITCSTAATREREVGQSSAMLVQLAKDAHVAMLVLAQLNRSSVTSRDTPRAPQIADLRDSGQIEQDADAILLLHRPARHGRQGLRVVQMIIGKSRHWPIENGYTISMVDAGLRWVPAPASLKSVLPKPMSPALPRPARHGVALDAGRMQLHAGARGAGGQSHDW